MKIENINIKDAVIIIKFLLERKNFVSRKDILDNSPWGSSKSDLILKELIAQSILLREQNAEAESRRGRIEYVYSLNPRLGYFVGIELSNYYDRYVIMDFSGAYLAATDYPPSYNSTIDQTLIKNVVDFLGKQPQLTGIPLLGITLGLHGIFHEAEGKLLQILGSDKNLNLNIRDIVQKYFSVPVSICHPRHLILTERYGLNPETIAKKHIINVIQSYGIGMGIYYDGHFINGVTNQAGEIGHIVIPGNKKRCYCGNEGCLRTLVSFKGIIERTTEKLESKFASKLNLQLLKDLPYEQEIEHIIDSALEKDTLSMKIIHETAEILGSSIASAVTLFNPDLLIVHSSLCRAEELFSGTLRYNIETKAFPKSVQSLEIEFSLLSPFSTAKGAAIHALLTYLDSI